MPLHDQVAQHRIVETEASLEFVDRLGAALDVEQRVVGLGQMLDGIGKRATAPVLDAVDFAAFGFDERLVTLEHAGHLLALVRMDQEHDFIVTHCVSSWVSPRQRAGAGQPPEPESGGEARVFDHINR
jgi:hypothetical protein